MVEPHRFLTLASQSVRGVAIACLCGTAPLVFAPLPAFARGQDSDLTISARLRDQAMAGNNIAFALVESLTTEIGPRPAGSPAFHRAADWAVERMTALGFSNVHREVFPVTRWIRGEERAEITSPYPQNLVVTAIGGSVATPPLGIQAPIALFSSYDEFLAAPAHSLAGRIVVVSQPMPVGGYSGYFRLRSEGPDEAARRGAVAYLLRSLTTEDRRSPHTGTLFYADGSDGRSIPPRIPAAALSAPDAEQLDRMAARGKPIIMKLVLSPTIEPNQLSETIVGDIVGREPGAGVVLIGGHLDSWDLGTGALDDGAGVAITLAAARLIGNQAHRPRRTIRVALFGAEEIGVSRNTYAGAHGADEQAGIAIASECDLGADHIYSVQLPEGAQDSQFARELSRELQPIGTFVATEPAVDGGSDLEKLVGVPLASLRQEDTRYFNFHHSTDDTLDKIDRNQLNQNVAAWTVFTYLAAASADSFRSMTKPKR